MSCGLDDPSTSTGAGERAWMLHELPPLTLRAYTAWTSAEPGPGVCDLMVMLWYSMRTCPPLGVAAMAGKTPLRVGLLMDRGAAQVLPPSTDLLKRTAEMRVDLL